MVYGILVAQAAIIASVALFDGTISTVDLHDSSGRLSAIAPVERVTAHDKPKLRCRLYFGCAPSSIADSRQD